MYFLVHANIVLMYMSIFILNPTTLVSCNYRQSLQKNLTETKKQLFKSTERRDTNKRHGTKIKI